MSVERSDLGRRFPDGRPEAEQPAWRQDFPIDWPQDNYVARRDYAKFLVLTSLAFAVGQLWIGVKSLLRRGRGRPPVARVARLDDVPVGGTVAFSYPGRNDPCLLVRPDEGTVVAYGQKCTHLSCAVVPRPERGELHCPCHVGSFDLATGRPVAGPPRRPLPRVTLEVRRGVVYATGVEERMV
jgi:nitrite reductase/ring-hydroxylating ferredoxin subunit